MGGLCSTLKAGKVRIAPSSILDESAYGNKCVHKAGDWWCSLLYLDDHLQKKTK